MFVVYVNRKRVVSNNAIDADVFGIVLKKVGLGSAKAAKNSAIEVTNNPNRALENAAGFSTAVASRNLNGLAAAVPSFIKNSFTMEKTCLWEKCCED